MSWSGNGSRVGSSIGIQCGFRAQKGVGDEVPKMEAGRGGGAGW